MKADDDPYQAAGDPDATDPVFRDHLFADNVVLVSGGTGGIGRTICHLFGRLGATIVACGRTPEKLSDLKRELEDRHVPCHIHPMTIRDPDQVAGLMDSVWDEHGRLDVLVNNAGGQFAARALDISPKGWNAVVETNLTGTWYMMQAAARRWVDHGHRGCIVNIVTVIEMPIAGIPHTVAARAGAVYLSKSLAVEWAPHDIRINCVAVGVVASPGLRNYPASARPSFTHNPMRRMGSVHDVALACGYLAGPSGQFITGAVVPVTGGQDVWGEYWPLGKPEYFRVEE